MNLLILWDVRGVEGLSFVTDKIDCLVYETMRLSRNGRGALPGKTTSANALLLSFFDGIGISWMPLHSVCLNVARCSQH